MGNPANVLQKPKKMSEPRIPVVKHGKFQAQESAFCSATNQAEFAILS